MIGTCFVPGLRCAGKPERRVSPLELRDFLCQHCQQVTIWMVI
jgi:hypothetical protein